MSYILYFQTSAYHDLKDAFDYFEGLETGRGVLFTEAIDEMVERLEDNPLLFQKVHKEKRRAITRKYDYHIIYQVDESLIRVTAVVYASRNPRRWQNKK
ncbi:MAG: plasmid stabilization system protein ParE [Paraglaciecola sp.]|jgi:plasmid stabilization system protein ParE